jgi:nicotinamide mononucleotide transporter
MLMDIGALLAITFEVGSTQFTVGDALGFTTGLLCVWLTARASIWNFTWGILNSAILGFVFWDQRLFADSALQVIFIVLSLQGWVQWATGRNAAFQGFRTTNLREQASLLAVAAMMSLLLWMVLVQLRGSSPPMDAVITALSLCAQWQLNRRQVASWIWWIAVDLISVPLYWSRGLYLIAALYVIFLAICVHGLRNWRQTQGRPNNASEGLPA